MLRNQRKGIPSEAQFLCALRKINGVSDSNFRRPLWEPDEALIIIRREIKRLNQEKPHGFESLSLDEVFDCLLDAPLPSSQRQIVAMNEIVLRLKSIDDFVSFYVQNRTQQVFSVTWDKEHQKIFLCGWLSLCQMIEDVKRVWAFVNNRGMFRYPRFLILKRAAEILAEQGDTA